MAVACCQPDEDRLGIYQRKCFCCLITEIMAKRACEASLDLKLCKISDLIPIQDETQF